MHDNTISQLTPPLPPVMSSLANHLQSCCLWLLFTSFAQGVRSLQFRPLLGCETHKCILNKPKEVVEITSKPAGQRCLEMLNVWCVLRHPSSDMFAIPAISIAQNMPPHFQLGPTLFQELNFREPTSFCWSRLLIIIGLPGGDGDVHSPSQAVDLRKSHSQIHKASVQPTSSKENI